MRRILSVFHSLLPLAKQYNIWLNTYPAPLSYYQHTILQGIKAMETLKLKTFPKFPDLFRSAKQCIKHILKGTMRLYPVLGTETNHNNLALLHFY